MTAGQIADTVLAVVFLVAAAAALSRSNSRPTGVLAAIVAATWIIGIWVPPLLWAHRAALVYLVFAFPGLVPRPRAFIAVAGALSVASTLPVLALDERASIVIAAAVIVGVLARYVATPRLQRGAVGATTGSAALLATAFTAPIALRSAGAMPPIPLAVYCTCVALVLIVPVSYALAATPHSSTVTGLIVDLSDVIDTGTLRMRLARALGDPSLRIGYFDGPDLLLGDDGRPLLDEGVRTRTPILLDDRPVAVLLHDPALRIDPALAQSIGSVIAVTLRNVRLNDDVRARALAIAESRERLLQAEESARRDIERALRDGPIHRFERAAELIHERDDAPELLEAVDRASTDVRRFGRGLLPAAALESDLGHSLSELAQDFPFRIDLDLDGLRTPLPRALRPTIWFACAEAVTNAAKYAEPQQVAVSLRDDESGGITITVTDDGHGGARMGPGLRGIAERVETLGGSLELASPVGAGTTVRVRLPVETLEPA